VRLAVVGLVLALSGCGTYHAWQARTALVGATEPDVISCLGVPDSKQFLTANEHVMQWVYAQTGTDVDLDLGIYELKLGRPGVCHTIVRFDQGYAVSVHYADSDVGPDNPDDVCGRMVVGCLSRIDHTTLPADFSPMGVMTGAPVIVREGVKKP
jgi:hypothetical protein